MKIEAFAGPSNSGKTTQITAKIREYVAEGQRVGAIKHPHHALNEDDRGDPAKFRAAGADPVILAGDGEAVVFRGGETARVRYGEPDELLELFAADIVLIEGFKDRIWRSS